MNESDLPGYRGPMQPIGQVPTGHRFADRKQSGLLAKIIRTHMPKKPAPRRRNVKGKARAKTHTIEADSKVRVGKPGNNFY